MDAEASLTLPAASPGAHRTLYFFRGKSLGVETRRVSPGVALRVRPDAALTLFNGSQESELLLLQGQPIGEPVVQRGPFVMNDPEEIRQAFADYRRTAFGGWGWTRSDPVHARAQGRFAIHADGREERAL
jgi:redox-sensitive bicupin YhaK (pirin superfamily)